ncbi:MAG: glycosyltransferase family A protein [Bergeyella zoohelcum]|nr:glycosyltransferase family A protein [Bergeyella zoohelcum]
MKITIFTPTYNRAHTLPKVYESLVAQTSKNFEWILVDDGSTDGTEELIKSYVSENKIDIKYYKQPNQGKHIAINTGLDYAQGDYFLVLDSDDHLADRCVVQLLHLISKIEKDDSIAGVTFIRSLMKDVDTSKFGNFETFDSEAYQWEEVKGEMSFCYKTSILKNYKFPKFEGERFCPESLIHNRIGQSYKVLYTDNILAFGAYLEGGLTSNFYSLLLNNPRYSMLWYKEKINTAHFRKEKKNLYANAYWDIALKAKHIPWREKIFGIPIFWTIKFFVSKFKKRLGFG